MNGHSDELYIGYEESNSHFPLYKSHSVSPSPIPNPIVINPINKITILILFSISNIFITNSKHTEEVKHRGGFYEEEEDEKRGDLTKNSLPETI